MSARTVERAKQGVAGRRVLERMRAVAGGEVAVFDRAREERIEAYAQLVARRGGWSRGYVWDRRPARPVSWLEDRNAS